MKNVDRLTISVNANIKDALMVIDAGDKRICFAVDGEGHLVGTISDGDVRRGLLNGVTLDECVSVILHRDFVSLRKGELNDAVMLFAKENEIYQIPVVDDRGILIGVEEVRDQSAQDTDRCKVVLMVGGLGSRLKPLTDDTPKPMLRVGGRPILETIIENFVKSGFSEFIFGVNYKSEIIRNHFGDGSRFGAKIEYVVERQRMGTAGALSLMKESLSSDFIVMNGDLLTNINPRQLFNYHYKSKSAATMCVREYDFQIPYGVVNLDGSTVLSIDEKPVHSFFVNAGIYMLSHEVLNLIPDNKYYDMTTLFESVISHSKTAISFPIREYWLDIGDIEEYERANREYGNISG